MEKIFKKYRSIIVVGGTGAGKTTYIKHLLKKFKGPKLLYDVNNEYDGGIMMPIEAFNDLARNVQNHLILFEEATIFFGNKGGASKVREMLVRKRHTNNVFIFTFHGLQFVPLDILNMSDLMVIFETGDNVQLVMNKFKNNPKIWQAFQVVDLMRNAVKYFKVFVKLR